METEYLEYLEYRILVVDANKKRADNLKFILDGLYFTDVENNIDSAINYINNTKVPNLIITADKFPSIQDFLSSNEALGGVDLCQHIQSNEKVIISEIPILVLMTESNSQNKAKLFNSGASDIISTPFDMLDLFSRIELQLDKLKEKRKLFDSIKILIEDKKVRNRKNVDFRTKLFAKQRDLAFQYEEQIKKLKAVVIEKNIEIESTKLVAQDIKRENIELFNELKYLKNKISSTTEKSDSHLKNLSYDENELIHELFIHLNTEHLFEEELLKVLADNIIQKELDFSRIDNFTFINKVPNLVKKYIKDRLEILIKEDSTPLYKSKCEENLKALIELVSKTYINKFLFYFAIKLLEEIAKKEENATKFLKFYDGRIEIGPNGLRYQKPVIGNEKDGAWNMISMIQIINQRANGQKMIEDQKFKIQKINKESDFIAQNFNLIIDSSNTVMAEELKKQKPLNEKMDIFEDMLIQEKSEIDGRDFSSMDKVAEKIKQLNQIREDLEKNTIAKEVVMTKYSKQITYYKPTEAKFTKIALSIAKVMIKIKAVD